LATTATSSTWRRCPASNWSAWRNSCAMSGQSEVHTGSRKVSSTTLPRRLARLTCRPSWLVSWNAGARKFSGALDPSSASAMIGEAVLLADAAIIGTTPMMATPSAPTAATVRGLAVPSARASCPGRSRSRQPAAGAVAG
jgi:hypothetical protein